MQKLIVNEIFLSINGETSSTGMPTTFIRLAGCNLDCWGGCDTTYALDQAAGQEMALEEILAKVKALGCPRICLTGGEPLLDRELSIELLKILLDNGFLEISVETNGSVNLASFKERFTQVRFTMDLKTPSSGMDTQMLMDNLRLLTSNDEIKFVIANEVDFSWALERIEQYQPKAQILFSPMYEKLNSSKLVDWVLKAKLWSARVQVQLHKYIWSPDKKGV